MRTGTTVHVLTYSLLLALLPMEAAGAAERPLSLEEAIALALEKNEGIRIERESLASAESAVTGAKGAYDPFLEVQGGWLRGRPPVNSAFSGAPADGAAPVTQVADALAGVTQLLPTGGEVSFRAAASRGTTDSVFTLLSPAYTTQVGVGLRQPLLRDRAVDAARFGLRVTGSDREQAIASLRRETADTVSAVEIAYWRFIATLRAVTVREEAVRLAEEQLSETQLRIEGGAAPETEIAQPRAELERRRGDLFSTRELTSRAQNSLKLLILSDVDALWADELLPTDEPQVVSGPVDIVASLNQALASRPELEAAEAELERRRAETAFASDGVLPQLDVIVSYDRLGLAGSRNPAGEPLPGLPTGIPNGLEGGLGRSFATLGDGDFYDARAAVVFQIPIGNRTARATAAIARSTERQAEADLERVRKEVRAEVLDAAAALETATQRIDAARAAREAAEVQLSSEQERYAVGLSTNFLVLTRQNDLSLARLDEIAAHTDYQRARTEMARATGTLLDQRGIQVNGSPRPANTESEGD
ncbi:MAG: TolC family protein [Vicinamibacteria bacterium]